MEITQFSLCLCGSVANSSIRNPQSAINMPDWKQEIRRRLAGEQLEPAREAAIVEELAQHLDDCYAELLASGATEAEAYQRTLAELSGSELLARELRRRERPAPPEPIVLGTNRRSNMMADLWQDLRYGARMLMKSPGITLIIALTLALGIGANTTLFSLLDAVFLRPLPGIAEAERIVQIVRTRANGQGYDTVNEADSRDYRDRNSTFTAIAAEFMLLFHLSTDRIAEPVSGAMVSGNYFNVFGVRAAQGRLLQASDDEGAGAHPVAVISERLWRNQLGAEPVIGKTISLNSYPFTIIGVAAEFNGTSRLYRADVWIPIAMRLTMRRQVEGKPLAAQASNGKASDSRLNGRAGFMGEKYYGRLKPGVTIERAQADISTIAARLRQIYPETNADRGARVIAGFGMEPWDRRGIGRFIGLFGIVVLVVQLIACANVAGLLLARAFARRKEMGIRLALGAGRFRIARQLLTESAMLALLGGALAIVVALWLTYWIRAAALPDEFRDYGVPIGFAPNWRVLSFTLVVSIATGLLFGLAPALQSSQPDVLPALKDSGASFSHRSGGRLRCLLVVAQIALSLILLISAGLFVRTLQKAYAINVGFAVEGVLTAKVDLRRQGYSEAQGREFYQRLLERAASLPGAHAAGLSNNVPWGGRGGWSSPAIVDNQPIPYLGFQIVTPGYLDTLGIPLLAGRQFTEQDDARSSRVAIINETFARQGWPNQNPVGKIFKSGLSDGPVEVIGVVRDTKNGYLFEERTTCFAYFPLAQKYDGEMTLHLRAVTKPELLIAAVRQEIRMLDPKLPVYHAKTLEQYRRDYLRTQRLQAAVIGGFGLLALALASLGLYGALSYSVAQRTQEIGVRMALGARTGDVLRLVVGQGVRLIAIGVILGLAGAFATARVLKSLFYGISPTDPLTFIVIPLLLTLVALLACWIPARRATKVDPLIALRHD
jgi:predicted permease